MQTLILLLVLLGAEGEPSPAVVANQQEVLLQALEEMGAAAMAAESPVLRDYVMKDPLEIQERLEVFERFYALHPFTEHHGANLYAHIRYGTANAERQARFSGAFAAVGLRRYWQEALETGESAPSLILPFLESLFNDTPEPVKAALGSGIQDALAGKPLPIEALLNQEPAQPTPLAVEAMQTCITLGACAKGATLSSWVVLPAIMAAFHEKTGVWLFGGAMLNPIQIESLESVLTAVPPSLHGIAAVFVPEVAGISAAESPLRLPGYALDVPLLDLEAMRDISQLPPFPALPAIPEFTALLLGQAAQAVTALQFQKRPDLAQRCFQALTQESNRPGSGLEAIFPPDLLHAPPDQQMVHLAYLWLLNGDAWLEAALGMAEQQVKVPLLVLLLAADLFSEQADTTWLLQTTPAGMVFGHKTALRRTQLEGLGNTVTGIALRGRVWQYDMAPMAQPVPF